MTEPADLWWVGGVGEGGDGGFDVGDEGADEGGDGGEGGVDGGVVDDAGYDVHGGLWFGG